MAKPNQGFTLMKSISICNETKSVSPLRLDVIKALSRDGAFPIDLRLALYLLYFQLFPLIALDDLRTLFTYVLIVVYMLSLKKRNRSKNSNKVYDITFKKSKSIQEQSSLEIRSVEYLLFYLKIERKRKISIDNLQNKRRYLNMVLSRKKNNRNNRNNNNNNNNNNNTTANKKQQIII
uniref:Uncharacterized protein n=1 Tax=Glossina austeni TaxID=7395 RepID=A0A1A9UEH4_GLOAU